MKLAIETNIRANAGFTPKLIGRGALALWMRSDMGLTINDATISNPNAFDNVAWAKQAASVSANVTTDPFGGNQADSLIEDNTTNDHRVQQVPGNYVGTRQATFSVYAKAGTRIWAALGDIAGNALSWYNLSNGTLGTTNGTVVSRSIVAAGNGWYQLIITAVFPNGTLVLHLASADGVVSYAGDGASNIFIYGAAASQPKVSAWADQSGQGHHIAQATAANQPLLVSVGVNGHPLVRFGTAGTDSLGPVLFTLPQPVHMLIVYQQNAFVGAGAKDIVFDGGTAGSDFLLTSSTANQAFRPNAAIGTSSVLQANGVFAQADFQFNGVTSEGDVDRAVLASGNAGASAMGGFTMGSLANGTRGCNVDFAEAIIYSRILSTSELLRVRNYLKVRYGTP